MCPPTHSAYQDAFGAGTYKFVGNTYTETTEFFYAPQYIGTSLEFDSKLDGDLWYTSRHLQHYEGARELMTFCWNNSLSGSISVNGTTTKAEVCC